MTDPFNCYPLKIDWELARGPLKPELYPAPRITSREESALTPPAPALALAAYAAEKGWETRIQYAQGNPPHGSTGRPTVIRDSFAVRFGKHPMTDRGAYTCYERPASGGTWTWSGIMIWGPDLPPYSGCGVTELKEFLINPTTNTESLLRWVESIKARRAAQAAAVKARPKATPRSKNEDAS